MIEQIYPPLILKSIKEIKFLQKIGNVILYSGLSFGTAFVIIWFSILLFGIF